MRAIIQQLVFVCLTVFTMEAISFEVRKDANIKDASGGIIGLNHIALSVKDLDRALDFYQKGSGFELLSREVVSGNAAADALFAHSGIEYEVAVLKAPNMLFELTEFKHNADVPLTQMPAQGPGMTHTCFQSPKHDSGYDKFIQAGAKRLSRGTTPVDLGGYGVTYAYVYDPEGNMLELEQLDGQVLARAGYDKAWQDIGESMWMSQVGLATHDLDRLMNYYQQVLGFEPYRKAELKDNEKLNDITNIDDLELKVGWFRLNQTSKVLEIWEYENPPTPKFEGERALTALGYSFSLEVDDIQAEFQRLKAQGVALVGTPVQLGNFWQVYARDPDGNIFSLRQVIDPQSTLSVRVLDREHTN